MPSPLLSTYSTGENRVTASTIAVFERIDLGLVRELLAGATGSGDELRAVSFENQVTGADSIPDARISARFDWWFETKTQAGAYASEGHSREQLRKHAGLLEDNPDARLFVLTPDSAKPAWLDAPDGVDERLRVRILWIGFGDLARTIVNLLSEHTRLIGEQTRFLLTELVSLYESTGLLSTADTVVVAARSAWPEYRRTSAYVCQPNRSFRDDVTHLAFYTDGAIQPAVATIRSRHRSVPFTTHHAETLRREGDTDMADLIERLLEEGTRSEGADYYVMLLSPITDPATVHLGEPIENDTVSSSGTPFAWTLGQRYTNLQALRSARHTSDLG